MIPQTILTLVGFLLFVAPGLLYELCIERSRPGVEESTFREISRVALTSLIFSLTALLILAAVWTSFPDAYPDLNSLATDPLDEAAAEQAPQLLRLSVTQMALSCFLAWIASLLVARSDTSHSPYPLMWNVLHPALKKPSVPIVALRLDDGRVLQGQVAAVEYFGPLECQRIALAPPVSIHRPGKDPETMPPDWHGLVVPLASVREMWFTFRER